MMNAFDKSITDYKHHLKKAIEAIDRLGEEFKFIRTILSEIDKRTEEVIKEETKTEEVSTGDAPINLTQ